MRADPNQRSLRGSEANLVIVLDLLRIGINLDCKSQFYIVDCSLVIVSPKFFTLKRVVLLVFLGRHIIVLFTSSFFFFFFEKGIIYFFVVHDMCDGCLT